MIRVCRPGAFDSNLLPGRVCAHRTQLIWMALVFLAAFGCANKALPPLVTAPAPPQLPVPALPVFGAPVESTLEAVADPRHVVGDLKYGIILVNFSADDPRQTAEDVRRALFEHPYSIARFVEEVSYGAVQFTGDIVGWYSPNEGLYGTGAEYTNCYPAVSAALNLAADELELAAYDGFLIIVQDADNSKGCAGGNASFGPIPVDTVQGRVHARIARTRAPFTLGATGDFARTTHSTVAHELTHSFGYHFHAGAYVCGQQVLSADAAECQLRGTWDQFDIMGIRAQATHPGGAIKEALGWLHQDEMVTVSRSGRYQLDPYEQESSAIKALKIPLERPIVVPYGKGFVLDHLYLEYRSMSGIDERSEFFRTIAQEDGTRVHLGDIHGLLIRGVDTSGPFPYQVLLDGKPSSMTPAYPPHEVCDAQFTAGQRFWEPLNGIEVRVVAVEPGRSLVVDVNLGDETQ